MRVPLALTLIALAACGAQPDSGAWTPRRPVEFVVASGPGGGSDQLARIVQSIVQKGQLLDVPVIVTTKPGGSGSEAFVYAKSAGGDPHKVVFATNNVWLLPLVTDVGYAWTDLRPLATIAVDEFLLWVKADAPHRDVVSFLEAARSAGGRLQVAGSQSKDTDQVLVRQIEKAAGVSFTYVPFRSGSEAAVQLAGGHVDANINNPQENVSHWRAGMVRPLCVFAPSRLAYTEVVADGRSWADIPTCSEAGLPIERYQMPRTVWLPDGVTEEQATFYLDLFTRVRSTDEWKAWLARGSQSDLFLSGRELSDFIARDEAQLRAQFTEDGWLAD